jgi:hypothetical protein
MSFEESAESSRGCEVMLSGVVGAVDSVYPSALKEAFAKEDVSERDASNVPLLGSPTLFSEWLNSGEPDNSVPTADSLAERRRTFGGREGG